LLLAVAGANAGRSPGPQLLWLLLRACACYCVVLLLICMLLCNVLLEPVVLLEHPVAVRALLLLATLVYDGGPLGTTSAARAARTATNSNTWVQLNLCLFVQTFFQGGKIESVRPGRQKLGKSSDTILGGASCKLLARKKYVTLPFDRT
jgi:hypothetical protein